MRQTIDDSSYYRRTKTDKHKFVYDYVAINNDIEFVFDVGCNNANISYPLQRDLGKRVCGIDLSKKIKTPLDYDFKVDDVVTSNDIIINDCTLFMSLYHHILGHNGIDVADDVFYKLLLRTNHLIFDTGNLSEVKRGRRPKTYPWYNEQKKHFKTEVDLLNHFNLDYKTIGRWAVGGGYRSVVVFKKDSFDAGVDVLGKYKRKNGSRYAHQGLFDFNDNIEREWDCTVFHKLKLGDKVFFSKKHTDGKCETILKNRNETELKNTIYAHQNLDPSMLIGFYGWSDKYGFIFEWVENIEYIKKMKHKIGDKQFKDVDLVIVNGEEKIIDFQW